MLTTKRAMATLAVKNLETASKFYEGVLGLKATRAGESGALVYETGGAPLFLYVSQYAGSNAATAVTWVVGGELEALVGALAGKGLVFEHYDLPGATRSGDIHQTGATRIAWFKDPDGNIHSLTSR